MEFSMALSMPSWTVFHGDAALPKLVPVKLPSTYSMASSFGTSPHGAGPHPAIARQEVSPGTAIMPGPHGEAGKIGSQPIAPSCTKPAPQPPGGTPAGTQVPVSSGPQPGAHPRV